MAAQVSGIWNHAAAASQALPKPTAMDSSSDGTDSGSDGDSATISANDFLTLLVTEMQNQDPTADTDPNEYINQLVNVNSLEQLISINQTLSSAMGGTDTGTTSGAVGSQPTAGSASVSGAGPSAESGSGTKSAGAHALAAGAGETRMHGVASHVAPGNLSVPAASPSAHGVASALDGQSNAHPSHRPMIAVPRVF